MSLKLTENLYIMTMTNDQKFEEELTCGFKTGTTISRVFVQHSNISKICIFSASFWPKYSLISLISLPPNFDKIIIFAQKYKSYV